MGKKLAGRTTAEIEGDFVVFLIGGRPGVPRVMRSLRDLGGKRGMKHMLAYLGEHPEKGLLGYEALGPGCWVEYWRSFEHLEAFASDADDPHLDAWRNFTRRVGTSGRTGIWHEAFLVRAGEYEAVYTNMPVRGLARAGSSAPLVGRTSARERLRR
ncbi:MAG: DUF4188 domain-containing protein [Acidimicrobiia bacterium]